MMNIPSQLAARPGRSQAELQLTEGPANVTSLLEHTLGAEAVGWFEVIAAGDIVPSKKPAPDIYDYALKALKLPPEACLAFEDSGNGIRSSCGAGLRTIIAINDYTRTHDFSDAALVLDQFGEPGQPCQVLAGNAVVLNGSPWLDVSSLQRLHGGG